jgi:hypothetical protein
VRTENLVLKFELKNEVVWVAAINALCKNKLTTIFARRKRAPGGFHG